MVLGGKKKPCLIELFKMVRGISTVPLQTFFKLADESITRGHRPQMKTG